MPDPGFDAGLGSADVVTALLAAERGWIDPERVDVLAEELRARRAAGGRSTSLLTHLLDRELLDEAQAAELKQLRAALGSACRCGHVTYRAPGASQSPPCERCVNAPPPPPPGPEQVRVHPALAWGCGLLLAALFVVPSLAFLLGYAWLTREPEPPPLPPVAAGQAAPFLWVIERDPPAYLLGTIHALDPRLLALPPQVEEAFSRSSSVWTEVPLDRDSVAHRRGRAELPAGETIAEVLPPDLLRGVERAWARRGLSKVPERDARLQPWALAYLLPRLGSPPELLDLDTTLWTRAAAAGKRVRGLETVEEQVEALEAIDGEELLRQRLALDEASAREGRSMHEPLIASYLAGNLDALEAQDRGRTAPRGYRQKVVVERSQRMAARIDEALEAEDEQQRAQLFAVGVGHLPGPSGILVLLSREGHVIRRVGAR